MKRFSLSLAILAALMLSATGCSSAKSGAKGGEAVVAPAKSAAVSQEQGIRDGLEKAGRDLVGRASRTVMPSKSNPSYFKSGKSHVIQYVSIDTSTMTTDMRKGSTASAPYVGIVSYREDTVQCRGSSKADAMSGKNCSTIKSSNRNEMIRYDGKAWQF